MDFELRFPEGLEHLNRMVSTSGTIGDLSITELVTYGSGMEYEHLMGWIAFHQKEMDRQLQESIKNENYERAAELRDKLGRKAR